MFENILDIILLAAATGLAVFYFVKAVRVLKNGGDDPKAADLKAAHDLLAIPVLICVALSGLCKQHRYYPTAEAAAEAAAAEWRPFPSYMSWVFLTIAGVFAIATFAVYTYYKRQYGKNIREK